MLHRIIFIVVILLVVLDGFILFGLGGRGPLI